MAQNKSKNQRELWHYFFGLLIFVFGGYALAEIIGFTSWVERVGGFAYLFIFPYYFALYYYSDQFLHKAFRINGKSTSLTDSIKKKYQLAIITGISYALIARAFEFPSLVDLWIKIFAGFPTEVIWSVLLHGFVFYLAYAGYQKFRGKKIFSPL